MHNSRDFDTDTKLMKAIKNGNKLAFNTVFHAYEKKLYYFVFSYTKSEFITEEIIQEVFIKLWDKREKLNPSKSLNAFLYMVARNHTFNYLKSVSRRENLKSELWGRMTNQYENIERDLLFSKYKEIVAEIVEQLPETKRSVYVLSKEQGKSNKEIASILEIKEQTVKSYVSEIMELIKIQLRPHVESALLLATFLSSL